MQDAIQAYGNQQNGLAEEKDQPSKGANGHTPEVELVTKSLAEFVPKTSSDAISKELSTKLKALLLDYLGVSASAAFSAESSPVFLTGVTSFSGGAKGYNTVLTKGSTFLPQYAALLNGAWCHTYDFDDTHSNAILHPGSSLISAALAEAESQKSSGSELLLALAVAYEVACRVGIALGIGSYERGFHNTGTVGLYGSIAAIAKLRNASQQVVEDAFGLAVSKAAGSMQWLENGAWNKRLHPGFAAHDALLCVSLAEAGVLGASKAIEGKYGLLHNYSESGDPSKLTKDLGKVWKFLETACKPFPACRMTHGQLEMVGKMRKLHEHRGLPQKITVTLPKGCFPIVGVPAPNKIRPECIVDAQFSSYFQVSASWIYGSNVGWAIYEKIQDEKVLDLCKRVTCEIDESYKALESRMKVVFKDGTVAEDEIVFPLAEPQRPFEWDTGVQQKFIGLAEPVYGEDKAEKIWRTVYEIENFAVQDLMALLA
jgi:2-methylcitrate dehydratase PrpD